jgi:hypothetical protein
MMSPLELDEHPTHPLRDHLVTLGMALVFAAAVLLTSR